NEERGYVLRRIIRRAVRYAYRLGAQNTVTPALVDATVDVMGEAYPDLVKHHDVIVNVITREEDRFRQTLQRGLDLLDGLLEDGDVYGEQAFFLHDTLGFPVDLTREIAEERGRRVDYDGFRARMEEQRARARAAVEGDSITAAIDTERRDRSRRNHTATHILHWALREVLGPHVKQAGSLVAPDRLRFDFSHFQAVTPDELDRIEALANREIITDAPV